MALTPLSEPGLFAVIDRIGKSQNLEEFSLTYHIWLIHSRASALKIGRTLSLIVK